MLGVGHTNHIAVQKWFEDSSGIYFTQCHRQVLDMVKTTVPSSAFMYKYVYFAYLSLLVAWDHRLEHSLKVEVIWKLIFQYISFLLCIEQAILCLSHYVQSTQQLKISTASVHFFYINLLTSLQSRIHHKIITWVF